MLWTKHGLKAKVKYTKVAYVYYALTQTLPALIILNIVMAFPPLFNIKSIMILTLKCHEEVWLNFFLKWETDKGNHEFAEFKCWCNLTQI